ncbi:MAG TPA: hypothetical protein VEI74_01900 [Candidatus Methylomirabilis sp.]|nr:hypothetical protein [Candidatus Methylomirabilis sp.]
MFTRYRVKLFAFLLLLATPAVQAQAFKPFIMGDTPPGDLKQVAENVKSKLTLQGFEIVGAYSPYPDAVVICATNHELKTIAAKVPNGGFGVAQRVAVTDVKGKIQVSYVNPAYLGTAYGMGKLENISAKLKAALGAVKPFGAEKGIPEEKLGPGVYRYAMMMPYFNDIDVYMEHKDYKTAVETVEKNLAAGVGGTKKVYRIDLPGKPVSVFGVAIPKGDGVNKGNKDTDKEIMDIVDFGDLKHTAYLPYEIMVDGNRVIALRARYRIALNFPDTKMYGEHGFTKIMTAPWGIQLALEAVAGFKRE